MFRVKNPISLGLFAKKRHKSKNLQIIGMNFTPSWGGRGTAAVAALVER
jgi:hypothetical protein